MHCLSCVFYLLTTLGRYKLKFSPDKVDTMVVQAIALLDDLDKEINIYAMRVKVCALLRKHSLLLTKHVIGMVWLALPRNGQNPYGQPRLRESRSSYGYASNSFI